MSGGEVRIVVPDDFPPVLSGTEAEKALEKLGELEIHGEKAPDEGVLLRRLGKAEFILNIRAYTKFGRTLLKKCPRLKLISVWGTGLDHIDLEAAGELGVAVSYTPGVAAWSVAEHALALIFSVVRKVPQQDKALREGSWGRVPMMELRGKTLGVLGLGAIGREVVRLGKALGLRVLAWTFNPSGKLAQELGAELTSFEEVLGRSDIISLHIRLTPDTRGLLGKRELSLVKEGAVLINTARGPIVDEDALLEALTSGRLAGAGLDVFSEEPLRPGHPLTELPNTVLTPHCAGVTPEATLAGLMLAVENIESFLKGKPTNLVRAPAGT